MLILISIAFNACTTTGLKKESKLDSLNLIKEGRFVGYTDLIGSSIDISKPFVEHGIVSIKYNLVKPKGEDYSWIDVQCYLDDDISWKGFDSVKITYKSMDQLAVSLCQPVLLETGESYRYILPRSEQWKTCVLAVASFKQPEWSSHKNIALDLQHVKSLGIAPVDDGDSILYNGSFYVKELIAFVLKNKSSKGKPYEPIVFNSVNNNKLYFTVRETGDYIFEIKDTSHHVLLKMFENIKFSGLNEVFLNKKLSDGLYIITISNKHDKLELASDVSSIPAFYKDTRF